MTTQNTIEAIVVSSHKVSRDLVTALMNDDFSAFDDNATSQAIVWFGRIAEKSPNCHWQADTDETNFVRCSVSGLLDECVTLNRVDFRESVID
jgi:hypothetical protein